MISEGKFMDVMRGFVRFVIASCLSALPVSLSALSHETRKNELRSKDQDEAGRKKTHLPQPMI
jgi:hypothetical protein